MFSHQRGLYKTTRYIELFEFVDGFNTDGYIFGKSSKVSNKFKQQDLERFAILTTEYTEIFKRATTVYATSNDEARLQRLFIDISEFIENRPHLLI